MLSDPEKRKTYDLHGEDGLNDQFQREQAQRGGGGQQFHFNFDDFFGGGGGGGFNFGNFQHGG